MASVSRSAVQFPFRYIVFFMLSLGSFHLREQDNSNKSIPLFFTVQGVSHDKAARADCGGISLRGAPGDGDERSCLSIQGRKDPSNCETKWREIQRLFFKHSNSSTLVADIIIRGTRGSLYKVDGIGKRRQRRPIDDLVGMSGKL